MNLQRPRVEVNGRHYAWPSVPVVVVCIDGSEPDYDGSDNGGYIERAVAAGAMPYLAEVLKGGTYRTADSVVPAFTNPNNLSIVTGAPPAVHGICGNFFYDADGDGEVMMNDVKFLRSETILAGFERAGAKIVVVTAKDKLRGLLGAGLNFGESGSICFSAEKADQVSLSQHGICDVLDLVGRPLPSVYSAELSEFVFAAGVELLRRDRPELMYLSTTDYIQHKHAPGTAAANDFYAMMDEHFAALDAAGAVLAVTADHGMKAKHDATGAPDVIYLQTMLDEWLGSGAARVICPITDPYVVHHGALGGYVTVYLAEPELSGEVIARIMKLDGIECAVTRQDGCRRFELPPDRVGDVIVISRSNKVLGTSPERHDLSGLSEPLRSHGGLSEQKVPLIVNRATPGLSRYGRLRNFDIFDVALNLAQP